MGKGGKGRGPRGDGAPQQQQQQHAGASSTRSGLKIERTPAAAAAASAPAGEKKTKPAPRVVQISIAPKKAAPKPAADESKKEDKPAAAQPATKSWADVMKQGTAAATEPAKPAAEAAKPAAEAAKPAAATASRPAPSDKKGKALDDEVQTKAVIPKDSAPQSWTRVTLDTNYFPVLLGAKSVVYEYGVTFTPLMGDSSKRKFLIRKQKIPSEIVLMGSVLYSNAIIPDDKLEWVVPAREAGMREDVSVRLNLANTFSEGNELPSRIFAALFQRALTTAGYRHMLRNFFDFNRTRKVPGGKYLVIPGVEVAVVPSMSGLSLVADVTNKVARTGTVLGMLNELRQNGRERFFAKDMERAVVYTNYNNRSYTVKQVRMDMKPSDEFVLDDGKKISYALYVKTRYNKQITTNDQPMLECERRGEKLYLIPEFCQPTGFDDRDRRDFKLMSTITKELFPEPRERQNMIIKEVDVIKKNTTQVTLNVAAPCQVTGSVIKLPPLPEMKARSNLTPGNARVMAGGKDLKRLCVVCDRRFRPGQLIDVVTDSLGKIGLKSIEAIQVDYESRRDCSGAIRKANPDFVLFVSPNTNDKRTYSDMKMLCTHQMKIPSQVVSEKNLTNPKRALTVIMNVARQMAVKLGKCPWVMPFKPITKGTMVFGLDVCHTTSIHKSVVGVVASLDDTFGKYISDFIVQDRGKEIVGDLKPFVKKALEKYKKKRGSFPQNVLFLRDGVGDGQLMYVNDVEMTAIDDVIKEISPSTKFTFVVVKKRIRARLFNKGGNPIPGTLVDSVVTHPNWYDFFLVSHETRNGTVSPTHYNVLLDDMQWPKSDLQEFIYMLCYQYYNWDGSISVPAPCQYAHKMAFLYGRTLLSSPDRVPAVPAELEETLLQI